MSSHKNVDQGHVIRIIIKTALMVFLISYPAFVYFGLNHFNIRLIALTLLGAMIIRAVLMPSTQRKQAWGLIAIGTFIGGLALLFNDAHYLRLYPVLMSLLMFVIFSVSLVSPPTIIELLARMEFRNKPMPDHVVQYTRKVTKIWCVFLALNCIVAALSVTASWEIWTLYNGLISYILMGVLFASEFIYRHLIVKKRHHDSP